MAPIVRRAAAAILLALLFGATPALAHERVIVGDYEFTLGWQVEPVIVGLRNGLELFVAPVATEGEEPAGITGLDASLVFSVEYGDVTREFPLVPAEGEEGAYLADFLPTRAGQYTFHFTGDVEGQAVDLAFEPEEVVEAGAMAFPEPGVNAGDLASKLATTQTLAIAGVVLGAAGLFLAVVSRRRS
jgi:hypothetical protein